MAKDVAVDQEERSLSRQDDPEPHEAQPEPVTKAGRHAAAPHWEEFLRAQFDPPKDIPS